MNARRGGEMSANKIPVSSVVFREDLYPRINHSPATVDQYSEDISVLPPIELNQHNELIDGWHRWTAHKQAEVSEIAVVVTKTKNEAEFLELAIRRNAKHGLQLSLADKRDMAIRIYSGTPHREKGAVKSSLSDMLSVSERTIRNWLSDTDRETKEKFHREAFDLWLACYTEREIAEKLGIEQKTVNNMDLSNFGKVAESSQTSAIYALDNWFMYDVWKDTTESECLDRLIWGYTEPFDVVCDPFASDGPTIDVCKKRLRRYMVSDLKPKVSRAHEVRQYDVVSDGALKPPQWKDVRLVYLNQGIAKSECGMNWQGILSEDVLVKVIKSYARKVSAGCKIALFAINFSEVIRQVDLRIKQRIHTPISLEQSSPEMVEWAIKNKQWLDHNRQIVVWEK